MNLSHEEKELTDRFLKAMLEATVPLQAGLDQEVTWHALIRAAEMLKDRPVTRLALRAEGLQQMLAQILRHPVLVLPDVDDLVHEPGLPADRFGREIRASLARRKIDGAVRRHRSMQSAPAGLRHEPCCAG